MADRIVPQNYDGASNGDLPVQRLAELQYHINRLVEDPEEAINTELFEHVELQLTESNIPPLLETLLPPLRIVLDETKQDPTPILSLATRLLSPLSLSHCLNIVDPPSLILALQSPLPGASRLALSIIQKAARGLDDIQLLSTFPEVLDEILHVWLANLDVGVATHASNVINDLLTADCDVLPANARVVHGLTNGSSHGVAKGRLHGDGLIWRFIFQERHGLSIISSHCNPENASQETSFAQARLLRLLPRLMHLNYRVVSQTPFPDLFPLPEPLSARVGTGLLQWAALSMVDTEDVIMAYTLTNFYEAFVSIMRVSEHSSEKDRLVRELVKTAMEQNDGLEESLRTLPNRTVEEEAEPLRVYLRQFFD